LSVELDMPPALADTFSSNWNAMSSSASVLRFVESRFDPPKRTLADTRQVLVTLETSRSLQCTLDPFFFTMAKAGAKSGLGGSEFMRQSCKSSKRMPVTIARGRSSLALCCILDGMKLANFL